MFSGLSGAICADAWGICRPAVIEAANSRITNKIAGSIIVLSPQDGTVLYRGHITSGHPDAVRYDEIALAKARVSWATGLPSRRVQQDAPHLYQPGMTKWGGSVIQDKLVVAFSGVQAVFDEAIASMMLAWIIAICRDEMTKLDGVMNSEGSYIGQEHPLRVPPPPWKHD